MKERVQKLMAQANKGSRRACEEIIRQGRVRVNGVVIKLGDQADPNTDVIEVDGEKLLFSGERKRFIAFNKPKHVVSTDELHEGDTRKMVRDFIPFEEHLFSIGRLDADSEGLMVLTNDGELANRLTHPRYRHTKTYKVVVAGLPTQETVNRWQNGVFLEEDGQTAPCYVKITDGSPKETTLRIVMTEGKKRQIRRVAVLLGHPVKSLTRTHIGKLALGTLRQGEWRELTPKDVKALSTPADELVEVPKRPARRPPRPFSHAQDRDNKPQLKRSPSPRRRAR